MQYRDTDPVAAHDDAHRVPVCHIFVEMPEHEVADRRELPEYRLHCNTLNSQKVVTSLSRCHGLMIRGFTHLKFPPGKTYHTMAAANTTTHDCPPGVRLAVARGRDFFVIVTLLWLGYTLACAPRAGVEYCYGGSGELTQASIIGGCIVGAIIVCLWYEPGLLCAHVCLRHVPCRQIRITLDNRNEDNYTDPLPRFSGARGFTQACLTNT